MSSSSTHTSITMFTENNSKIIGNWYFDASDSKELVNATFNGLKALVESLEHNKSNDGQAGFMTKEMLSISLTGKVGYMQPIPSTIRLLIHTMMRLTKLYVKEIENE